MSYRIEAITFAGAALVHGGAVALGFVAPENAVHAAMRRDAEVTTEIEVEVARLPDQRQPVTDFQPTTRATPTSALDNRRVQPRGPRVNPLTAEPEAETDDPEQPPAEEWSLAPELGGGSSDDQGGWTAAPGTGIDAAPVWMGAGRVATDDGSGCGAHTSPKA